MKFGLLGLNIAAPSGESAIAIAREAEQVGFESIWAADHVVMPDRYDSIHPYDDQPVIAPTLAFPEPLTWLAHVAAATTRIRLGTGVLVLPQRNPVLLAKTAATLDTLSNGRLTLGVGIGWLREEKLAVGVDSEHAGARSEEYIRAMRELWMQSPASFRGEYCEFDSVHCIPQPLTSTVPVLIGGHSEAAARRAGRVGDGLFAWDLGPDALAPLIKLARATATEAGRDPTALDITAGGPRIQPDDVPRYAELGVGRVVLSIGAPLHDLAKAFIAG